MKPPTAVVMNMFHSGLGIARSLGERGVSVIGLTAQRGIYGNVTRYARVIFCPDSRSEPEALLECLLKLGQEIGQGVIFPTRDDDVVFLDRFREELKGHFILVIPQHSAVTACLNKWETHQWARRIGVSAPKCWLLEREGDLSLVLQEVTYPCVLKPVASHHWHRGRNWQLVGGRKAVCVISEKELVAEYGSIVRADSQVLVEEAVQGSDECLVIAACYLDRQSQYVAGFNTQKLVQTPEGFGTGCIVQTVDRSRLFGPTVRLLQEMHFSGIAEVEYKWDAAGGEYKLIEINPRPWDQHRLGNACGVDLIYLAYCDHAGLAMPAVRRELSTKKWIAEDAFIMAALSSLRRRDQKLGTLVRFAQGKRIFAIWSIKDPAPFVAYVVRMLVPRLIGMAARLLWSAFGRIVRGRRTAQKPVQIYENSLEKR
jgi:D-aspartate ligase